MPSGQSMDELTPGTVNLQYLYPASVDILVLCDKFPHIRMWYSDSAKQVFRLCEKNSVVYVIDYVVLM